MNHPFRLSIFRFIQISIVFAFTAQVSAINITDVREALRKNQAKVRQDMTSVVVEGELSNLKSKRKVQMEGAVLPDGSIFERRYYDAATLAKNKGASQFSETINILRPDGLFRFSRPKPGEAFELLQATSEQKSIDRYKLVFKSSLLNYLECAYSVLGYNALDLLEDPKLKIIGVEDVKIENVNYVQVKFDARETDRKLIGGTLRFRPDKNWSIAFAEMKYLTLETPPAESSDTWTIELGNWPDGSTFPAIVENRVTSSGQIDVHQKMTFLKRDSTRDMTRLLDPETWGMPKATDLVPPNKSLLSRLLSPIILTLISLLAMIILLQYMLRKRGK